jgi:hypothetical protein
MNDYDNERFRGARGQSGKINKKLSHLGDRVRDFFGGEENEERQRDYNFHDQYSGWEDFDENREYDRRDSGPSNVDRRDHPSRGRDYNAREIKGRNLESDYGNRNRREGFVSRGPSYTGFEYGTYRSLGQVGPHSGKGPKGYKRSDDRIREEACEALTHDHAVDAREIDVSVSQGHISLKGNVENRAMKRRAEESVEHLTGVVDVRNELRISTNKDKERKISNQTLNSDLTNRAH